MPSYPDLSIVFAAPGDGADLVRILPELRDLLQTLHVRHELLIVTAMPDAATQGAAGETGAIIVEAAGPGYGIALAAGLARARGEFVMTVDPDAANLAPIVRALWDARTRADILIASRYAAGGRARMPMMRRILSRALNLLCQRGLSLPLHDLSSSIRLYRAAAIRAHTLTACDFDALPELLVRAYADGRTIAEVPFAYRPSRPGMSTSRAIRCGLAYLRTLWSLWKLRNSILAADYDDRAHDSPIALQRYWQRSRHRHVTDLIANEGPALDVGCGSSRILAALPRGSVGVDILARKLRYARKFGVPLVRASGFALPFPDRSFSCVLCSQVIEHVPKDTPILDELCRVLAPGGRLVLGTPDYANWQWVWIEKAYGLAAPGGYADEHIAHYTFDELVAIFEARGFTCETHRYILQGELIMAFRKGDAAAAVHATSTAARYADAVRSAVAPHENVAARAMPARRNDVAHS
jgi:SAM-dependent methyltransferase